MSALEIRFAAEDDAADLARLLGQLGYAAPEAEIPLRLRRLSESRGSALVAVHQARIVGLATAHLLSVVNRARDVAWLTALVVDGESRRLGVGRALVRAVEDYARAQDCEWLSVTTHETRADAQAFYASIGMDHTGRRFGKSLSPRVR